MPSRSPFRFFLGIFFSFFCFFIFARAFSATLRSSPGTREIFVRIKAPGINIPWSREGVARGASCRGSVVGRAGEAQGGACVPPSLAKQREHYRPFASQLHHLLTSRNSPPFSLSPVPRTLSSSCCLSCCLCRTSRPCSILLFLALSEPRRRSSPVPSLSSPIPATPFFPIHDVVRRRRGGRDSRFRSRGGCLILSTH